MARHTLLMVIRRYGAEMITLAILVPLVVVLGVLLNRSPVLTGVLATPSSPVSSVSVTPSPPANVLPAATAPPIAAATHPVTAEVTIVIAAPHSFESYTVGIGDSTTVAQALMTAQQQGLQMKTKDYGGSLGLFIEELSGVSNNPAKLLYWRFYINDVLSPAGASTARVKNGDTIRWVLEQQSSQP